VQNLTVEELIKDRELEEIKEKWDKWFREKIGDIIKEYVSEVDDMISLAKNKTNELLEIKNIEKDDVGMLDWIEDKVDCAGKGAFGKIDFYQNIRAVIRKISVSEEIKAMLMEAFDKMKNDSGEHKRDFIKTIQSVKLHLECKVSLDDLRESGSLKKENEKLTKELNDKGGVIVKKQEDVTTLQNKIRELENNIISKDKEINILKQQPKDEPPESSGVKAR